MSDEALEILAMHLASALETIRTLEIRARVQETRALAAEERIRELQAAVLELGTETPKALEIAWPSGLRTPVPVQLAPTPRPRFVDSRELAARIVERERYAPRLRASVG